MEVTSTVVTRASRSYVRRHEAGTPVLLKRVYQFSSCTDHTVNHFKVGVTGSGEFTGVVMILLIDDESTVSVSRNESVHVSLTKFFLYQCLIMYSFYRIVM
jgi:hypothetical protein